MADLDLTGNTMSHQVVTIRGGVPISAVNYSIFQNNATMKTYLLANGYTAAQLVPLTKNDMISACRQKLAILQ